MKKPKILSIDDEADFTDFLKQYFEPRGYEIDIALEGMKGLELLKKEKYDVVLLDLKMAGLNGEEVLEEIKRIDGNIKTISVTAYLNSGTTKNRLLKQGAFAFVEKPGLCLKELEELINKAIDAEK